eukprot:TRINITY_DN14407_c0_g1_i1.p1 TRINITY_DN14407_c0_g1~~TRINITY_DN14407_c0_g1_i1.p1  ORF type:complete len:53 (+),score=5.36 TRINITY_DN14407_c0_g1_i1:95-253(+)
MVECSLFLNTCNKAVNTSKISFFYFSKVESITVKTTTHIFEKRQFVTNSFIF